MVYVIVDLGRGKHKGALIFPRNVGKPQGESNADTYLEKVFDQHPDIEKMMQNLCKALVECRIDFSEGPKREELVSHFYNGLAKKRPPQSQETSSSSLQCRRIKRKGSLFHIGT